MITSARNARVKKWKKLHHRKTRYEWKQFLIEGFHLLEEALKSGWGIKEIIKVQGVTIPEQYNLYNITEVSSPVFNQIAQTESPQGIIAVVEMKKPSSLSGSHIMMIDAIQDPGNLGTIIRTADAAGYNAVVLGDGTVDIYNDKVIRATQGSIFHIPIISANLRNCIDRLQINHFKVITSALKESVPYQSIDKPEKVALIVGNEGNGIDEAILSSADMNVHIPIYGDAESLNVSVAAGILMYHFR